MTLFPVVPDWKKYPEWGRDMNYSLGEAGLAGGDTQHIATPAEERADSINAAASLAEEGARNGHLHLITHRQRADKGQPRDNPLQPVAALFPADGSGVDMPGDIEQFKRGGVNGAMTAVRTAALAGRRALILLEKCLLKICNSGVRVVIDGRDAVMQ